MSSLELRQYQLDAVEALRDGFRAGKKSQVLYVSTGGGKTEIAIHLMEAAALKGKRAAMILDRIVLCNQTSERLDKYRIDHGVLQAGHWRFRPYEKIQVCSAQTLEKREDFPCVDLLVIDECHCVREKTLDFIKAHPDVKVIGLSATPFSTGLGKLYDGIVSTTTTEKLVNDGFLVPLRVFVAKQIDMTGAKKTAGEWKDEEAGKRGIQITGDIVSEWVKKTHELFGRPVKTIVFCAGVAHGQDLQEKFAEAGHDFRAVSYKTDDQLKADIIKDFARTDTTINGLIATDILTKGFDCPDVLIGISARPFAKSLSQHIQQMGRVMRSHPGKEFAAWICHSGNYLGFEDDWNEVYSDGVHNLDDGKEKQRKELTDKDREAARCPMCAAVWPGNSDICANCGHQRVRRNDVQVMAGEVFELDGQAKTKKSKATFPEKQEFYSQLLWIQREYGYKSGWVAHKYRAKFDVWPRGLREEPMEPSHVVRSWIRSQQIKHAKSAHA